MVKFASYAAFWMLAALSLQPQGGLAWMKNQHGSIATGLDCDRNWRVQSLNLQVVDERDSNHLLLQERRTLIMAGSVPNVEVLKARLRNVLDPEMDESILERGLVRCIDVERGHVSVQLQLPTGWCAPNFVFIMAEDVRRALLPVENVTSVRVRVGDHVFAERIENAVNRGATFAEAFPGEAFSDLTELRQIFLRKGFLARQERLLVCLRDAGWSFARIASLRVDHVVCHGEFFLIGTGDGQGDCQIARSTVLRYLERRRELGIDDSVCEALITDADGIPVVAEELPGQFKSASATRLALETTTMCCCAMLDAQRQDKDLPLVSISIDGVPHDSVR